MLTGLPIYHYWKNVICLPRLLIKASCASNMCVIYDMLNLADVLPLAPFSTLKFILAEPHSSGHEFPTMGNCVIVMIRMLKASESIYYPPFFRWLFIYLGDDCSEYPPGLGLSSTNLWLWRSFFLNKCGGSRMESLSLY